MSFFSKLFGRLRGDSSSAAAASGGSSGGGAAGSAAGAAGAAASTAASSSSSAAVAAAAAGGGAAAGGMTVDGRVVYTSPGAASVAGATGGGSGAAGMPSSTPWMPITFGGGGGIVADGALGGGGGGGGSSGGGALDERGTPVGDEDYIADVSDRASAYAYGIRRNLPLGGVTEGDAPLVSGSYVSSSSALMSASAAGGSRTPRIGSTYDSRGSELGLVSPQSARGIAPPRTSMYSNVIGAGAVVPAGGVLLSAGASLSHSSSASSLSDAAGDPVARRGGYDGLVSAGVGVSVYAASNTALSLDAPAVYAPPPEASPQAVRARSRSEAATGTPALTPVLRVGAPAATGPAPVAALASGSGAGSGSGLVSAVSGAAATPVMPIVAAHVTGGVLSESVSMSKDHWMPDEQCHACFECGVAFSAFQRKHHCRSCGRIFCGRCTENQLPGADKRLHRVCQYCFQSRTALEQPPQAGVGSQIATAQVGSVTSAAGSATTSASAALAAPAHVDGDEHSAFVSVPVSVPLPGVTSGGGARRSLAPADAQPRVSHLAVLSAGTSSPATALPERVAHGSASSDGAIGRVSSPAGDRRRAGSVGEEPGPRTVHDALHVVTFAASTQPAHDTESSLATRAVPQDAEQEQPAAMGVGVAPDSEPTDVSDDDGLADAVSATDAATAAAAEHAVVVTASDVAADETVAVDGDGAADAADERTPGDVDDARHSNTGGAALRPRVRRQRSAVRLDRGVELAAPAAGVRIWRIDPRRDAEFAKTPRVVRRHVFALVQQILGQRGVPIAWSHLLVPISWRTVSLLAPNLAVSDLLDMRSVVKIKCVVGGDPADSEVINGLAFSKNVIDRRMRTDIANPRILLLGSPLEFERQTRLVSLDAVIGQEVAYLERAVQKIIRAKPDLVLARKSIARLAQEELQRAGISVMVHVKDSVMVAVARMCQATVFNSVDDVGESYKPLGKCERFFVRHVGSNPPRPLAVLEGCGGMGCSVLLRGCDDMTLTALKLPLRFTVFAVQSMIAEQAMLRVLHAAYGAESGDGPSAHTGASGRRRGSAVDRVAGASRSSLPARADGRADVASVQQAHQEAQPPPPPSQQQQQQRDVPSSPAPSAAVSSTPSPDVAAGGERAHARSNTSSETEQHHRLGQQASASASASASVSVEPGSRVHDDSCELLVDAHLLHTRSVSRICNADRTVDVVSPSKLSQTRSGARTPADERRLVPAPLLPPERLRVSVSPGIQYDIPASLVESGKVFPADHQQIVFLHASVLYGSNVPCRPYSMEVIRFYGSGDLSLFLFLEANCSSRAVACTDPKCRHPQVPHDRVYVCGDARVDVSMERLDPPPQVQDPAHRGRTLVWVECRECVKQRPTEVFDDDMASMSFGMLLEHFFFGTARSAQCGHSLFGSHDVCFRKGSLVARFRRTPVLLHNVLPPTRQFVGAPLALVRQLKDAELQRVTSVFEDVFGSLNAALVSAQSLSSDVDQLLQAMPQSRLAILEQIQDLRASTKGRLMDVAALKQRIYKAVQQWLSSACELIANARRSSALPPGSRMTMHHRRSASQPSVDSDSMRGAPFEAPDSGSATPVGGAANGSGSGATAAPDAGAALAQASADAGSGKVAVASLAPPPQRPRSTSGPASHAAVSHTHGFRQRRGFVSAPARRAVSCPPRFVAPGLEAARTSGRHDALAELFIAHLTGQPSASPLVVVGQMFGDNVPHMFLPVGPRGQVVIVQEGNPGSVIAYCMLDSGLQREIAELRQQIVSGPLPSDIPQSLMHGPPLTKNELLMLHEGKHELVARWESGKSQFRCKFPYCVQFEALRAQYGIEEDTIIEALSWCAPLSMSGGKSGSQFMRSLDGRFLLKTVSHAELDSYLAIAPQYFRYQVQTLRSLPSCLVRVLGLFRVGMRHAGRSVRLHYILMENAFFGHTVLRTFDLKGSMRSRYVDSTDPTRVLLDENFTELTRLKPLFVSDAVKHALMASLWNDTLFLASAHVMDYSLLLAQVANGELVVGVVDYLRKYTWDKRFESLVKSNPLGGPDPTVISPQQYKERFRAAMERYFVLVPNKFTFWLDVR